MLCTYIYITYIYSVYSIYVSLEQCDQIDVGHLGIFEPHSNRSLVFKDIQSIPLNWTQPTVGILKYTSPIHCGIEPNTN